MDHKGETQEGGMGLKREELPQMDGSCDACEPDEAQPATQVCHTCSFAFCPLHADKHASSTHHLLTPYNHEGTQANDLGSNGDPRVAGGAEDEDGAERGAEMGVNQAIAALRGVAMAGADESGDAEEGEGAKNGMPLDAELGEGAEGAEAGQEAMAAGEAGKRDTVTVERLRCKEHGQEGSLYCKPDEKIICVVCAVQGEHREHEIITLHEAYVWQKNRQGYDLLGCTQQMAEKIKTKWTNPEVSPISCIQNTESKAKGVVSRHTQTLSAATEREESDIWKQQHGNISPVTNMSTEELEAYVNDQFDELRRLVRLEERRTLHLVDLKEAFLTASAAEKIAEITVQTERLQEEMANITHQLCLLEQVEAQAVGPAVAAEVLVAGPAHRVPHDIEARPRRGKGQIVRNIALSEGFRPPSVMVYIHMNSQTKEEWADREVKWLPQLDTATTSQHMFDGSAGRLSGHSLSPSPQFVPLLSYSASEGKGEFCEERSRFWDSSSRHLGSPLIKVAPAFCCQRRGRLKEATGGSSASLPSVWALL
eukprot:superscaffoldBa00000228_g2920